MRVLIVCTGNICRSPVIEAVLAEAFPELEVSSAGTRARNGADLHPLTADAVTAGGLTRRVHASRLLDERALAGVELVLTAERAHRSVVLGLRPDLLRRTFTLPELVALGEAAPVEARDDLTTALAEVTARRGRTAVDADDVPDPVDAGPAEHERMVRTVVDLVDRLDRALRPG